MNKNKGNKFEKKVQKCINSGSIWFDKGDLKTDDYLIECKYTEKKGFRISTKILKKLWNEALERNKLPAFIIGIKNEKETWLIKAIIEREAN
jgi:hypothetical protein